MNTKAARYCHGRNTSALGGVLSQEMADNGQMGMRGAGEGLSER